MATPPSFKLPKEVACGSLAASLTACLFNPLELVKTRLQVQHQYACTESGALMYSGFLHGLRKISAEEGVVALWRHKSLRPRGLERKKNRLPGDRGVKLVGPSVAAASY